MPEATGLISDIHRCSLNDGPGIRTTVFLKGCPLRCLWCHNPECISRAPQIAYWADRCTGCGACASVCPVGAHRIADGAHEFDRAACTTCGQCAEACPADALRLTGTRRSVADVMSVVERDRVYYETSGGGLTLSGGEPLAQARFAKALLAAARQAGVHTCLDTSGRSARSVFESALPLTDLVLFDYKATDAAEHRRLTGAPNRGILGNLDAACRSGARVWLRCPLVPGVNDCEEHLAGIASLAARYPQIEFVELMAYHNAGRGKYARYGMPSPMPDMPSADEPTKAGWIEALHALGCTRARLG